MADLSRRSALTATAAVAALSTIADPHIVWLERWREADSEFCRIDCEIEGFDPIPSHAQALEDEVDELAHLITATRPTTAAGAAAQLRLFCEDSCGMSALGGDHHQALVESALAFLEGCIS